CLCEAGCGGSGSGSGAGMWGAPSTRATELGLVWESAGAASPITARVRIPACNVVPNILVLIFTLQGLPARTILAPARNTKWLSQLWVDWRVFATSRSL